MQKNEVIRAIGDEVMLWQEATQAYDEQVGQRFGLNAAERHCIALLVARGPQTASAVARYVWLNSGRCHRPHRPAGAARFRSPPPGP